MVWCHHTSLSTYESCGERHGIPSVSRRVLSIYLWLIHSVQTVGFLFYLATKLLPQFQQFKITPGTTEEALQPGVTTLHFTLYNYIYFSVADQGSAGDPQHQVWLTAWLRWSLSCEKSYLPLTGLFPGLVVKKLKQFYCLTSWPFDSLLFYSWNPFKWHRASLFTQMVEVEEFDCLIGGWLCLFCPLCHFSFVYLKVIILQLIIPFWIKFHNASSIKKNVRHSSDITCQVTWRQRQTRLYQVCSDLTWWAASSKGEINRAERPDISSLDVYVYLMLSGMLRVGKCNS